MDYAGKQYATGGILGLGSGQTGIVGSNDQKLTFLDPLEQAHSSINDLLGRVQVVADRLCGPAPEPGQMDSAKLASVPNGLFDELAVRGRDMAGKVDRIHDLIGRIERSLP